MRERPRRARGRRGLVLLLAAAVWVVPGAGPSLPSAAIVAGQPPPSDTSPPAFLGVPSDLVLEANGPSGSVVAYDLPSATDDLDGPVPVTCAPAPGATFPLGTSTVTCTASDGSGNAAEATFVVVVRDTTAPVLNAPPDVVVDATLPGGAPRTHPTIAALLAGVQASDLVDPAPGVTNDAPALFPPGTTTLTFTAADASGNTSSAQSSVLVRAGSATEGGGPATTAGTLAQALRPPENVRGLAAKPGNRSVFLDWRPAQAPNIVEYVVTRSRALKPRQGGVAVIYRGVDTELADRGLRNGVEYRYTVFTLDDVGNTSAGVVVVAVPKAPLLARPGDGARVEAPVELAWVPTRGATYYNVQVFRLAGRGPATTAGATKILSAWPAKARLTLTETWSYDGRAQELRPGRYVWYVWPGLGRRADMRYGKPLGYSVFVVVPRKAEPR